MLPHDTTWFVPTAQAGWVRADDRWFRRLAHVEVFTVGERVHLARVALQQQWVCDVEDAPEKRAVLGGLGLHVAAEDGGFLIVSGSSLVAEYLDFRERNPSLVETGVLYGYPASAIVACVGIVNRASPLPWPTTAAEYFLGGVYSRDRIKQERAFFAWQWEELRRHAPDVCELAERSFEETRTQSAA